MTGTNPQSQNSQAKPAPDEKKVHPVSSHRETLKASIDSIEVRRKRLEAFNGFLLAMIVFTISASGLLMWRIVGTLKGQMEAMINLSSSLTIALDKTRTELEQSQAAISSLATQINGAFDTRRGKAQIEQYSDALEKLNDRVEEIQKITNQETPTGSVKAKAELESARLVLKSLKEEGKDLSDSATEIQKTIDSGLAQKVLNSIQSNTEQIDTLKGEIAKTKGPDALVVVVVELAVRIGILVLAIYLGQVLLGIYKYNARVANHYASLIESLAISASQDGPVNLSVFEGVSKILSASSLSFGDPEASPAKELGDIAKALVDMKKTTSS